MKYMFHKTPYHWLLEVKNEDLLIPIIKMADRCHRCMMAISTPEERTTSLYRWCNVFNGLNCCSVPAWINFRGHPIRSAELRETVQLDKLEWPDRFEDEEIIVVKRPPYYDLVSSEYRLLSSFENYDDAMNEAHKYTNRVSYQNVVDRLTSNC